MDKTLEDLKRSVIALAGDTEVAGSSPVRGTQLSAEDLKDAICAALSAISGRVWKPTLIELEGGQTAYDLPSDLIEVEGVYDKTTLKFLPETQLNVQFDVDPTSWTVFGLQIPDDDYLLIYPAAQITFQTAVGASGATVYYSAVWAKPTADGDQIEPRDVLLTPILFFAASHALMKLASAGAAISQFKTKVDSGKPTDIPQKEMSTFFLSRFEQEMARIPMSKKGQTF